MKIALIFTPVLLEHNWSTLTVQQENIGLLPPLNLAYVAAIAEKNGHQVAIIDAAAERLSPEEIIRRLDFFSPDLLGFSVTTEGFHHTLRWINKLKPEKNIPVVVGGWHLSLYPRETLSHSVIDYGIIGDADETFPEFLNALENGGDLNKVQGIAFKENGRIIITPSRRAPLNLDLTLFPARHLLRRNLYYNILSRSRNFTVMLSSRGCPFRCIFCDVKSRPFGFRSARNFVDEIEGCYRDFGITEFDIYDAVFTFNKDRVREICNELKNRRLNIRWSVRTRTDCVDKELLRDMAVANCHAIMFGIESADPNVLRRLRKDSDIGNIQKVIKWTKDFGMQTLGFFMIGSPGDTRKTIEETINFAGQLDLDYVHFSKTAIFPSTELYERYVELHREDYWRRFTLDLSFEKELPLLDTELTVNETLYYVRKGYIKFFFRPRYIWKAFKRGPGLFGFRNLIIAALGILLSRQHKKRYFSPHFKGNISLENFYAR